VYVSGGTILSKSDMVNSLASQWPYAKKNSGSSWNTFTDPISTSFVYGAIGHCREAAGADNCPKIQIVARSAQEALGLGDNEQGNQLIGEDNERYAHIKGFFAGMASCDGQTPEEIKYWDESATVLAIRGLEGTEFCTQWAFAPISVVLTNGADFGKLVEDPENGVEVTYCAAANRTVFIDEYWGERGLSYSKGGAECTASVSLFDEQLNIYGRFEEDDKDIGLLFNLSYGYLGWNGVLTVVLVWYILGQECRARKEKKMKDVKANLEI